MYLHMLKLNPMTVALKYVFLADRSGCIPERNVAARNLDYQISTA